MKIIQQQTRLLQLIGLKQYYRYRVSRNRIQRLYISGHEVWVRKGSPDFSIAHSCFNGEYDILKYLFPKDYAGVIVDAGGYIGTAAIAFSEMYPKATVLTIEPSADNFSILKKNIAKHPNIKAIHGALVASDEKIIKLYNRNTAQWGFTVVKAPQDYPEASAIEEVPALRISSLGIQPETIGILKLDIEGGEKEILTRENENLKTIPAILIELHDRIVDGCSDAFFSFSETRFVINDRTEKYLSLRKDFNS